MSNEESVNKINKLIQEHHDFFGGAIPLIASENVTSKAVRLATICDFSHRYAEGWPGKRVYAGCEYLDEVELMCGEMAKKYWRADFADVRPISGVVANLAIYTALTSPCGKMMAMPIPSGGHISHAPKFAGSGAEINGTAGSVRGLEINYLAFDYDEMNLNVDESAKRIREFEPELVLFGGSVFLFPHPVKELSDVAKEVGANVAYDAAHVAGLIGSGYFQDPLNEGADAMSFSTHKTFPGPQHGCVVTSGPDELNTKIKHACFPSLLSNHHLHNVAGFAIAIAEMLEYGKDYHAQVIKNAKKLGEALDENGFNALMGHKGYTESHQVVLDITDFEKSFGLGADIEKALEKAGIIVNRNLLPWDIRDKRSYLNPGGIRIGTSEVTRLGMKESEMEAIAEFFKKIVVDKVDPKSLRSDVIELRKDFQDVKYCFEETNAFEWY
ncbi:MAG: serine hydroxymethyltransferase [Candidatus Hodarchaeota archaeon]